MIRNLKVLALAGMVLAAFAALGASGAQAAGEQYHCALAPCVATLKPDETAGTKTAHHVFIVRKTVGGVEKSGSFTCNELQGSAESANATTKELTVTGLKYETCNIAGSPVTVDTNGCDYLFESEGGKVNLVCAAGGGIKLTIGSPVSCTVTVPGSPQQELTGIKYHNIGTEAGNETKVTVEAQVKNIRGTSGAGCAAFVGFEGEFTEAEYATGNTIVTADSGGNMVNAWWA